MFCDVSEQGQSSSVLPPHSGYSYHSLFSSKGLLQDQSLPDPFPCAPLFHIPHSALASPRLLPVLGHCHRPPMSQRNPTKPGQRSSCSPGLTGNEEPMAELEQHFHFPELSRAGGAVGEAGMALQGSGATWLCRVSAAQEPSQLLLGFLMDSAKLSCAPENLQQLCPRRIPTQINRDAEEGAGTL